MHSSGRSSKLNSHLIHNSPLKVTCLSPCANLPTGAIDNCEDRRSGERVPAKKSIDQKINCPQTEICRGGQQKNAHKPPTVGERVRLSVAATCPSSKHTWSLPSGPPATWASPRSSRPELKIALWIGDYFKKVIYFCGAVRLGLTSSFCDTWHHLIPSRTNLPPIIVCITLCHTYLLCQHTPAEYIIHTW